MKESELSQDRKRIPAVRSESVDRELTVERRHAQDSEALHDGKARAIDDREILVAPTLSDLPRVFQVGECGKLDGRDSSSQTLPELFGSSLSQFLW
jgi:hypothetical protein